MSVFTTVQSRVNGTVLMGHLRQISTERNQPFHGKKGLVSMGVKLHGWRACAAVGSARFIPMRYLPPKL